MREGGREGGGEREREREREREGGVKDGDTTACVHPTRGVKQGCPCSPSQTV